MRKYNRLPIPYGTLVGVCPEIRWLWYTRDAELELLTKEEIVDEPCDSFEEESEDNLLLTRVMVELYNEGHFSRLDRNVIALRLLGYTLEEIGVKLFLTRERIRQIESKVTRKLRQFLIPIAPLEQ
jgi:DNA-directed RNA polymerase sigma subunit (sigma70/sigma32)